MSRRPTRASSRASTRTATARRCTFRRNELETGARDRGEVLMDFAGSVEAQPGLDDLTGAGMLQVA
jgi:hypothetical protein